jgi:nitroreductase
VLATTRSVRRRLDLTQPIEHDVLEECLRLAQQALTASYAQNWHFVVVTDLERRAALGELWRSVAGPYVQRRAAAADERVARTSDAVRYLADNIHEVPVHVIPCAGCPRSWAGHGLDQPCICTTSMRRPSCWDPIR